ncbi:RagB/SusD family nutrient uptake outer membrane protein [Polaribacter sp. Z022]|uniref:RagB/SusD family nutrient uptake outer membrane protein n=1 Tax=Polaribacter sp. Z022 TaxID=2927125 RepID=UPI0020201F3A|nr:RagB/SusD family nutrient uptake outer membrane protein [Polaribacter sp. Z022]MCL7753571.1 RagB/SusD family nutrient uptake outer membrane protein [Polaribacter sp. Z022]
MKKILILTVLSVFMMACSDEFVDADLENIVTDDDIAKLAEESPEALLNIASSFDVSTVNNLRTFGVAGDNGHADYGQKSIDLIMDVMSNDMIDSNNGWWYDEYYKYNARIDETRWTSVIWNYYYTIIKGSNQTISLIGGIDPNKLTDDLKYVLARSKVMRGFCYYQLIQIYQKGQPAMSDAGIPLVDPTADLINGPGFGRLTVQEVYDQIEKDYTEGYNELAGYTRTDKTAINQVVAAGFLARFMLLKGDNINAIKYAKIAQGGGSLAGNGIMDGFQDINNPEWLFGADINADTTSYYASFFSQMQSYSPAFYGANGYTPGYPGQLGHHRTADVRLYNAISATDIRKGWFGYDNGAIKTAFPDQIYNYKFYDNTFFEADYVFMRVAEMYLIEAEANANEGLDVPAAAALYKLVSDRDPSYTLSSNTGSALMDEIRLHRRIELWGEGFGLLDMKRWGVGLIRDFPGTTHLDIPSVFYNIPAGDFRFTFQLPLDEINLNDAITEDDQNP